MVYFYAADTFSLIHKEPYRLVLYEKNRLGAGQVRHLRKAFVSGSWN
jgi:hypothetical protein